MSEGKKAYICSPLSAPTEKGVSINACFKGEALE